MHKEHDFFFLFDRKPDNSFIFSDNITPLIVRPQARHPLLYYLWFEHSVPSVLKKINADIFLSPDGYLSLKTDIPSISVIHDLNFEHFPLDIPFAHRAHYRYYFPRYAQKSERIATVSKFSANDISTLYNVDPAKIDVVYNGANERFTPVSESVKTETRNKYAGGEQYFLFVGAFNPRKNLSNLLKAFDILRNNNSPGVRLVVVGEKMFKTSAMEETYNKMVFKNDVIFTGRLQQEELHRLMASALALTYVSYFEGFGIPIVEAFRCETPVITANVTSMPEVAGDAALLVNPYNPDEIAEKMHQVKSDALLRDQLTSLGKKRAALFTWDKSAERLWHTIEKVASNYL